LIEAEIAAFELQHRDKHPHDNVHANSFCAPWLGDDSGLLGVTSGLISLPMGVGVMGKGI